VQVCVKNLISCTTRKESKRIQKKEDVDNICKGNIMKARFILFNKKFKMEKMSVWKF
jgi:hypothetical protein